MLIGLISGVHIVNSTYIAMYHFKTSQAARRLSVMTGVTRGRQVEFSKERDGMSL